MVDCEEDHLNGYCVNRQEMKMLMNSARNGLIFLVISTIITFIIIVVMSIVWSVNVCKKSVDKKNASLISETNGHNKDEESQKSIVIDEDNANE
jgi:hypothetical protein